MYATKRPGFAMILAIFVVVLIAMGGALLMRSGAQESKAVGDKYLRAQAELLAKSATEYAIMRVQGFETAGGNCLNQLNITVNDAGNAPMFDVNISLAYSFQGVAPPACTTLASGTGKDTTVLMDVTVTDHDLSTEPIRVHERSWQVF
ncbi:MAG: type II secretion system protein [Sulfuricurvum sp.]|nr:type II secretion system protein [Sulfuricurvum sp.]